MSDPIVVSHQKSSLKLKPNWKEAIQAIAKLLIDLYFKEKREFGADLVDLGASLGLTTENTPAGLACLLLNKALVMAIADILNTYCEEWKEITPESKTEFERHLSTQMPLGDTEFEIDQDFFAQPQLLKVLPNAQTWMESWLKDLVQSPSEAKAMSVRLPSYFTCALHDELLKNGEKYQILTQQFADTLVSDAYKREMGWRRYTAWLDKQLDEPIFAETFGIRPLYVLLGAYYTKKRESDRGDETEIKETHHARDLESAMDAWLENPNLACIRLISGGPGSGKSTFTKWWAAKVAAKGAFKVWHIPLNDLSFNGDLESRLKAFADKDAYLWGNPLEEPNLLIIFDGLDELALSGKVGFVAAENFIGQLITLVNASGDQHLKVLVSGRDAIIQSQINQFSKPEQIWHLLPYSLLDDQIQHYQAKPQDLLQRDRRDDWWRKYGKVKGQQYEGLPNNLKFKNLQEITAQPILNYLLAISDYFLEDRINENTNCNEIYQSLLQKVYDRGWAKKSKSTGEGKHPSMTTLAFEDFRLVLEEVGLCAWHGDGRKVTEGEIIKHCENSGKKVKKLLSFFSENIQNSNQAKITKLFTTFYFRERGQRQEEKTFEFTHKSFGEFLVVKRLVRAIDDINKKYRDEEGWTEKQALKHWAEICQSGALDFDLLTFLQQEIGIKHHHDPDLVEQWQETLCQLITYLLRHSLPMEELPGLTYHQMNRRAIQAEIALLAALNASAICTQKQSTIEWENENAFGNWLARIQGQRVNLSIVPSCLSWLNLDGANLDGANLDGASLVGASLDNIFWNENTNWSNIRNLELANNVPNKLKQQLGCRV